MSNSKNNNPKTDKLLARRQMLVVEAKKFETLLNDPSLTIEMIDASIEELRPIRLTIRAIDSQIRELLKTH